MNKQRNHHLCSFIWTVFLLFVCVFLNAIFVYLMVSLLDMGFPLQVQNVDYHNSSFSVAFFPIHFINVAYSHSFDLLPYIHFWPIHHVWGQNNFFLFYDYCLFLSGKKRDVVCPSHIFSFFNCHHHCDQIYTKEATEKPTKIKYKLNMVSTVLWCSRRFFFSRFSLESDCGIFQMSDERYFAEVIHR